MTKINLIEKRKKYIDQRINKLKEIQASLNVQERKKRTRRLIELGGPERPLKVTHLRPLKLSHPPINNHFKKIQPSL